MSDSGCHGSTYSNRLYNLLTPKQDATAEFRSQKVKQEK
jgi:hypothetical protein